MNSGKLIQPPEQFLPGLYGKLYNPGKPIFALLITGPEPGRKSLSDQHLLLKKNGMLVPVG